MMPETRMAEPEFRAIRQDVLRVLKPRFPDISGYRLAFVAGRMATAFYDAMSEEWITERVPQKDTEETK